MRDLYEAIEEPHLATHDTIHVDKDGAKHLNNPMRFTNEAAQPNWDLPTVGEHNIEILKSLGYEPEAIAKILLRV